MAAPEVYEPSNLATRRKTRETGQFVPFKPPSVQPPSTFAERRAARLRRSANKKEQPE
jgi:hypothetical protein